MNIACFPDFILVQEAQEMSNWILENNQRSFFKNANMGGIRKTTRYTNGENFEYPNIVKHIREKIVNFLNLQESELSGLIPPFKNGIVASCAFPGDTCYSHVDPVWVAGYHTLHCNILTQEPENGGHLILDKQTKIMKQRELVCYLVSKDEHETTKILGDKLRLMWIFGFCVTQQQWEHIVEKH
jgi:hypothetical protein